MQWQGLVWLSLALAAGTPQAAPPATPANSLPDAPSGETVESWAKGAQHFDGLGDLHRKVTTSSAEAQAYFDQGLRMSFGFNHDEATRSFAKAALLDPQCASCFWGIALTLGPNYNVPMLPDRAAVAWTALQKAIALAPRTTPVEQALIAALAKRYKGPEPLEPPAMQPFTEAYAQAMREVARKFPDDLDVQVLFAESAMDVNPWKLWTLDGQPAPGTEETVRTLEAVLAKDPQHAGANHYYIHAVEASKHPERALASAERLGKLMPGSGHIVHMAAHIYQRVGRYADAAATNSAAVTVDQAYFARTTPPGYYPMYLGHNYEFLAFSASMEGRGAASIEAARQGAKVVPPELIQSIPGGDFYIAQPLLVLVRFGRWNDLLTEPRPPEKYPLMTGLWLHSHGMALASKGRPDEAARDLAELLKLQASLPPDATAGLNSARDVMAVGAKILEARIAEARKSPNALALWEQAVKLEDGLAYSEPADWFYPVRHFQGAALLAAGQYKKAEAVFREDLRRNPGNGWALFGLSQALKQQKRGKEAAAAHKQFEQVWKSADVKLTSSVI